MPEEASNSSLAGEDPSQSGAIRNRTAVSTVPTQSSGPPPQFPKPSQCSKWLMLYWFAGFPPEKIHWLLSQYYKIETQKAYNTENIASTFQKLQKSANRNDPNFMKDPYMWHLMTAKNASPIEFRSHAIQWLEQHHPEKSAEVIENEEIIEMNLWHDRWMEEVGLMQRGKAEIYQAQAHLFKEKLDQYSQHFKGRKHRAYFEVDSPTSSKPSSPHDRHFAMRNENEPITTIERPVLTLRTRFNQLLRKGSSDEEEGTPIPGTAQHLDKFGFFAQRPKSADSSRPTSPDSINEGSARPEDGMMNSSV